MFFFFDIFIEKWAEIGIACDFVQGVDLMSCNLFCLKCSSPIHHSILSSLQTSSLVAFEERISNLHGLSSEFLILRKK
jgi:hypothetical protein